uniref:Uncharacterized protein n=1 Tax=Parascaris univalens TaxID=6257 RepID=A0A915C2M1_PARUN
CIIFGDTEMFAEVELSMHVESSLKTLLNVTLYIIVKFLQFTTALHPQKYFAVGKSKSLPTISLNLSLRFAILLPIFVVSFVNDHSLSVFRSVTPFQILRCSSTSLSFLVNLMLICDIGFVATNSAVLSFHKRR